jgi:N-acetylneuraminic acid mutarotase
MPDNRRDHFAFWTGSKMLVWGGSNSGDYFGATNPPNHNTQGKVYDAAANTWSDMAMSPPEITSGTFAAVWTGTEMILWGGQNSSANPPRAGRYDPATDTWQIPASIPGDPMLPQSGFTATWSGTEMIVWGGGDGATQFNSGYRYNPGANTWTTMTTTGAPETRYRHTATWVGSELVIWGGKGGSGPSAVNFTNGGRYDPTTDTWTSIADTSSIAARQFASSSAVAGQLIVWGGAFSASDPATVFKFHKNGGRLTPATSAWTTLATGSPAPRAGHSLIWTGTELIVWGGTVSTNTNIGFDPTFNDGARFNPATGVWTPLPSTNAPLGRYGHSAVWTGTEMIIFGGQRINATSMNETLNTGARYHPGTDTWTATDTATAPSARSRHTAVWTGSKMIVWGGTTDGNSMNTNTGAVYDPGTNAWTATTTMGGPMQGSSQHYAFWTGTDMILLGEQGSMGVNHRYNPTTDSWTANASNMSLPPMNLRSTSAAQWTGSDILVSYYQTGPFQIQSYSPVANFWQALTSGSSLTTTSPSSVWTGSDMIVFGLTTFTTPTFQAARFTPATGTWTNISTTGGPTRQIGSAVWTGSEMILWGGRLGTGPGNETSVHDIGSRYRLPQNYYFYRRP